MSRNAADGHLVCAGARKDKNLEELNAIKNVQAIRLDVTKPDEFTAADAYPSRVYADAIGKQGVVAPVWYARGPVGYENSLHPPR